MNKTNTIHHIIQTTKTIAVVGASTRESRAGHYVPAYMHDRSYRIIPVNPNYTEVLGQKTYPNLRAISEPVDLVLVFRQSKYTPAIVQDAIDIGARAIWLQFGITNWQAANLAREAGLLFVMDACIMIEHRRMLWPNGY